MHTKTALVLLTSLASAAAAGCSGKATFEPQPSATASVRASLHRAKTCGDLLDDLKADALYKLNKGIDRQIEQIRQCQKQYGDAQCTSGGYFGGFGERGVATDNAAPPTSAPTPIAGGADPQSDSGSGTGNESAKSYSETNTQVAGVDEADIVKNDGQNLYVLHGNTFKVIKAWPATELKESSSTEIEGSPMEMFVDDGKVVVYSQVNGTAVFAAAGVTPKTQFQAYGYATSGGAVAAPMAPGGKDAYGSPTPYAPLTKITVLTLDGAAPAVTREVYFEGNYLDARRVGAHVRTVLQSYQYGPQLKYGIYELYPQNTAYDANSNPYPKTGTESIKALENLRATNSAILNASQVTDWLPYTFVKNGTAVSAQPIACEDFYVPTAGSTETGLTEVASLDLSDPTAVPKQTGILGRVDTVYGNANTLYLAAQAWIEPPFTWYGGDSVAVSGGTASSPPPTASSGSAGSASGSGSVTPTPAPAPGGDFAFDKASIRPQTEPSEGGAVLSWSSNRTHVHKFEFASDPTFPNYVASGTVAGAVKDQFSLDEKDGNLRIATTEGRQYFRADGQYVGADFSQPAPGAAAPEHPSSVSHVFALAQNGPWLDTIGDVGDLAPNEQIQSVRFVGSRGYVVTFRRVDPLFVVDLAAPAKPTILAALKIPGFSEYMHPLDETHLLTIGRDAGDDGRTRGLQLQIFDVTNGAAPALTQKFTYSSSEYGSSEAEYDHKAFTYFADKNLLAFPYYAYGQTDVRSSLELFHVDLGTGFTKLGSIDHTPLVKNNPSGYCGGYYAPSVRRGVFLENFVYSISYGGVIAKDSNDLTQAGAELALPAPVINEGYGPACY